MLGDFNDISQYSEKKGGDSQPSWLINGLCNALRAAGLEDLGIEGYQFTWGRRYGLHSRMAVRLDRVIASQQWRNRLHSYKVTNLGFISSDHCPLLLSTCAAPTFHQVHRFHFENSWVLEDECRVVIQESWGNFHDSSLMDKLERCSYALRCWGGNRPTILIVNRLLVKRRCMCCRGRIMLGVSEY